MENTKSKFKKKSNTSRKLFKRIKKRRFHIKVAYIATINSLNEISSKSDILYCLAPRVKKENEYSNFFRNQSRKGKYVIVDDSIAENGGVLSNWQLVKAAIEVKASEIVCPDVIGDYNKTKIKRKEFLKEYYNELQYKGIKVQGVIQGKTLKEYEKYLKEIEEDDRIDIIGIPFRMEYMKFKCLTQEENRMLNRVLFIKSHNFKKPIHLLGNNLPLEIFLLKDDKRIRSIDSKLMVRYGLNEQIFSLDDKVKPKKKLYIENKLTKEQIRYSLLNIKKLEKEVLKNG